MRSLSPARSLQAECTRLTRRSRLRHARTAVSLVFFANGFVVASWLPHIPEVKERLALGDFRLGAGAAVRGLVRRAVRQRCDDPGGGTGAMPIVAGAGSGAKPLDADRGVA